MEYTITISATGCTSCYKESQLELALDHIKQLTEQKISYSFKFA